MPAATFPNHVVITGAAGALGRAVVERFTAQGARLALIDRDAAHLGATFAGRGDDCLLFGADVTSVQSMQDVGQSILDAFPRVDAIVHVAGGFEMGESTHALSRESWMRMMDLNAWSFVAVTGPFIAAMKQAGAGSIVAVSARGAASGAAGMGAYCASKSALQRLVESLSHEVRAAGINVNSIAPGILDTAANRHAMPDEDPTTWVSTEAAADAIAFLASTAARSIHGRHLVLDGLS
jgi:NAD(P)-dependent dehydrogenase (short-subunit alcohol dehydrogenase family)